MAATDRALTPEGPAAGMRYDAARARLDGRRRDEGTS